MTSREDSVLAARDPSLVDENAWEEFSLSEVRILVPGKSRYANLLTATPENPVQVTGCLDEVEEEQESLVLDPDYLTKRIVIDNVSHFAYGQHNDGEVGIWVAGQAGWFSISPAKGYRAVFNDVVEAIDLLYFLTDRNKPKRRSARRKKKWNYPSLEDLCDEYVLHTHGICEDGDDSAEVFYKHHNFLLSRMINGEEEVNWAETNIFPHICEKFPEDFEELRAQKEAKEAETEEEDNDEDEEMEDRAPTPDPTAISKAQADAIYKVILDLKEAGYLAKRQLNLELVASTLMDRFEIDGLEYAQNLLSSTATGILESMNEAKTNVFDWSKKVIYKELKAASKKNKLENVTFTPLRPRLSDDGGSSDEDSDDDPRPRHRKSVLRPKSQIASKRNGKRTRSTAVDYELSDDNQDAMDEFETPSKVRGHDLVRDPLSTRAKRRTRSILSDSESTPVVERTPLQETLRSRNTSVSAAELFPNSGTSHDANSPGDTWVCQVPGCDKIITRCTSKRGKEMVQDHSLAHADDTKAKVDLVVAEQRLNINLRVDNLLNRIRGMSAFDGALAALNGEMNGTHNEIGT
ncbi:hypothetical protein ASPVEDRAFT_48312 [Aspergillus versicolor CBS 583.65]|uniref:DNA (cytosine-5)-methyltransferase 1 replication foci domain-containing protein n=1 Tax=Aspergillus versicolor CBS 583.65 TaxID=1036611 RepID=A0A1L9P3C5_ASPVE|nr:uncharacterized protein ASPVEDRAFT_48312 [Aspergillus versicolor CBS 583.65]OJI96037.1 hypothetical protein ASPVEDRAFT_48312 [Aspergillus versicolor CBS 583.65]